MLSKDEILRKADQKIESVDVPEWGGQVYVRTLSGDERDRMEVQLKDSRVGSRGLFAALTICDENGNRLFADQDAHALGKKNAAALDRILEVGFRLNAMTEEAIEELEKN